MSRPTRRLRARARTTNRGFTLIEVLVSLLVFSLGVLGLAGFQALLTRQSAEASERGRAALMANELVAEMWKAGDTSLDDATLAAWEARVEDPEILGLPGGKAEITELDDEEGAVLIQITWTSVVRGNETSTYMTELAIPPLSPEE